MGKKIMVIVAVLLAIALSIGYLSLPSSLLPKSNKKFSGPVFKLENPSSGNLESNFYGPIPPEILASKNNYLRLVSIFGDDRFHHCVNSMAFSHDGSKLLSGGADYSIKIWDVATGREIRSLYEHTSWVNSVMFSKDDSKVISCDGSGVIVWDATTGIRLYVFNAGGEHNTSGLSPDGTKFVYNKENVLKIWDIFHKREILSIATNQTYGWNPVFSPDGGKIAWGGENFIKIWDISKESEICTLSGNFGIILSLSFSPDGYKLASGSNDKHVDNPKHLRLWDIKTQKEIWSSKEPHIASLVFSPDGRSLLSGGSEGMVNIWEVDTGKLIEAYPHKNDVSSLAISPDGVKVASAGMGLIKIWDREKKVEITNFIKEKAYWANDTESAITLDGATFSPDGNQIVSWDCDKYSIDFWDTRTGRYKRQRFGDSILHIAYSPDGTKIATGGESPFNYVWDVSSYVQLCQLFALCYSIIFSPDGDYVLSADNRYINVYRSSDGRIIKRLESDSYISPRGFSYDCTRLIYVGDYEGDRQSLGIWDMDHNKKIFFPQAKHDYVTLSSDGHKVACYGKEGIVQVWDVAKMKMIFSLKEQILVMALSKDGRKIILLIKEGVPKLKLYETSSGKEIDSIIYYENDTRCMKFSPDGKWILATNGSKILLYSCQYP